MDILDASALLAYVLGETGGKVVFELMDKNEKDGKSTFIHQINYSEFLYKCIKTFDVETYKEILKDFQSPFFGVVNHMDNEIGLFASHIKAHYALSLGDAIGLAFTKVMNGRFWTADKVLAPVGKMENIDVRLIR